MEAKFQFGNVVVVDSDQIGVIVKTWSPSNKNDFFTYEVYVRSMNSIHGYKEEQIQHYVYSKELSDEEKEWH